MTKSIANPTAPLSRTADFISLFSTLGRSASTGRNVTCPERVRLRYSIKNLASSRVGVIERRDSLRGEYDGCIERGKALNDLLGNENGLLEQAEAKTRDCEEKLQQLIKQIYDTQAQISGLNDSLTTYRALRDRFEGYIYSVKKLLSDARGDLELTSKISGLIADVVSCDGEYEVAIETAFGGAMQNVITPTREDARFLIEYVLSAQGIAALAYPLHVAAYFVQTLLQKFFLCGKRTHILTHVRKVFEGVHYLFTVFARHVLVVGYLG